MVSLGNYKIDGGEKYWQHLCGGAILSNKAILTAAHCTHTSNAKPYLIRAGDEYLNTPDDDETAQDYEINTAIKHGDYNLNKENDVAIIAVKGEMTFNDRTRPICYPKTANADGNDLADHGVRLAGWGIEDDMFYRDNDSLKEITLTVRPQSYCESFYPGFSDVIICAGEEV